MRLFKFLPVLLPVLFFSCSSAEDSFNEDAFEEMAINVDEKENRPISFANKKAAYYYTQSHLNNHPEHSSFEGLTVAQKHAFSGYKLFSNNKELSNDNSIVKVYPQKYKRTFAGGEKEEGSSYGGCVSRIVISYRTEDSAP